MSDYLCPSCCKDYLSLVTRDDDVGMLCPFCGYFEKTFSLEELKKELV